jgi:glutamine cyclotransferase
MPAGNMPSTACASGSFFSGFMQKAIIHSIVTGILWSACLLTGCSARTPVTIAPEIVQAIPHEPRSFVQGLFYDNGTLYESSGLYGQSALRAFDAGNGGLLKQVQLDKRLFGEGCAKMGGRLVQLTWREQTALTYSICDLSAGPALVYGGEGWGLTSDGSVFYMSNGSDTIFIRNADFTILRKVPVTLQGRPVSRLNELEYAHGRLFANVWYSDSIFEIDPGSGRVGNIVDCREIVLRENPDSPDCVLNGIAFDCKTGHFYITGKRWKSIFKVKFPSAR